MERELSVTLLPGSGQALRAYSALGDQSKTKRDTTTSRQLVMQLCDLIALRLSGRSGPQATLGQPRMAAHILLIFERASCFISSTYSPKGIIFPYKQAFDGERLDKSPWQPDLEVLLGGVYPTADSLTS